MGKRPNDKKKKKLKKIKSSLKKNFYNDEVAIYEMPFERSIDIDYYHQFLTAENIFKETLIYNKSKWYES